MSDPKVSIIIPVYNGSNYISFAIESAMSQTYQNIEIIVVNDGSTDNGETERVVLSYGNRVRYFYKDNGGVSSALNYGITKMTGEYFSWLSHDDMYEECKIQDSVDLLRKYNLLNEKCIAFTGGYFIDSHNKSIKNFRVKFQKERIYSGVEVVNYMTKNGAINGCCMLIPKFAFENVAMFNEELRYSQDSLMWYQLFLEGYTLISDNKKNVMYRLHRKQASQNMRHLYEHDSLIIAELLAESFLDVDAQGRILFDYTKRMTRNCGDEVVVYLTSFMRKHGVMSIKRKVLIEIFKRIGYIRYHIMSKVKRILISLRK